MPRAVISLPEVVATSVPSISAINCRRDDREEVMPKVGVVLSGCGVYDGKKILKKKGYPEELTTAIMGHANYTGVLRESLMAKALYAADEISGFMFAVTYVRPSKSIHDVKVKSVKKKLKQKSFAASVNREEVYEGPEELDVTLDEHIQFIIDALKEKAEVLGLSGEGASS